MQPPSLGWQSWSPTTPNLWHFPRRDYCPVPELEHAAPLPPTRPITKINYWCSWYALGYWPNPSTILQQAQLIKQQQLPITHILLDDGWRSQWLSPLVKDLKALHFKVGIWIAPFTRHKHLNLVETLNHLLGELAIDLLKLDFLYKPYFAQGLQDDALPHQTLSKLYDRIANQFPLVSTIACGAPYLPTIGHVDIVRLSKDTALPYPVPPLINRLFYARRLRLLYQKYLIWNKTKPFVPDPDVRMFSLDTPATSQLWGKMGYQVKGIGDNIAKLDINQLANMRLWLKN